MGLSVKLCKSFIKFLLQKENKVGMHLSQVVMLKDQYIENRKISHGVNIGAS